MKKHYVVLLLLILSGFIHLWNPVGFPDIFFDEGVYVGRADNIINTGNVQESAYFYDHPYLGQILLAAPLAVYNTDDTSYHIENLKAQYLSPRIFVGLLAVLDTFLVYMIASKQFNQKTAVIASSFFAVMPFTWILRGVFLDSLMLPFILASALVALYAKNSKRKTTLVMISGIILGLAIFTKIPAFTMIPVLAYLVFSIQNKWKDVCLCLIPILLIPLLWPAISMYEGNFEYWVKSILWQSQRTSDIFDILYHFAIIDPLVFSLGFAGIVYSVIRRNWLVFFWSVPFLAFFSTIGYKQYFHLIPLFPILCISGAIIIEKLIQKIKYEKITGGIIMGVTVFGVISTSLVITEDVSGSQFEAMQYVLEVSDKKTTILASPTYAWIFEKYGKENTIQDYSQIIFYPVKTQDIILVADKHFREDSTRDEKLGQIYTKTGTKKSFSGSVNKIDTNIYPYTSMKLIFESEYIEIKTIEVLTPENKTYDQLKNRLSQTNYDQKPLYSKRDYCVS